MAALPAAAVPIWISASPPLMRSGRFDRTLIAPVAPPPGPGWSMIAEGSVLLPQAARAATKERVSKRKG